MRHKSIRQKLRHFPLSIRAVFYLWREEYHFRFDVIVGFLVLLAAAFFRISIIEFLIIVLAIGVMLSAESINTAIEELCDHVTPNVHPQIGKIKDIGSAAVLLSGIAAFVIGCIIFVPRILALLGL